MKPIETRGPGPARALGLALALLLLVPGTGSGAEALEILFTSETGLEPLPCQCPSGQLGGWAQRTALLDSLRSAGDHSLTLDAGGWLASGAGEEVVGLALEALAEMGYNAINLGAPELAALRPLAPEVWVSRMPFVCSHPERPAGVPTHRVVAAGKVQVGVIGAGWFGPSMIDPPRQVNAALSEMPEVDLVVVLLSGGMGPARLVAERCGVDVVIYGEGARTPRPVPLAGALGVAPGARGRFVGVLDLVPGSGSASASPPAPGRWRGALSLRPVRAELLGPQPVADRAYQAAAAIAGTPRSLFLRRFAYRSE